MRGRWQLADDDDSLRKVVDLVVLYRVNPRLQLGMSVDFGAQEIPDAGDAKWRGLAGYARYAINDRHAIAIRAEQFRDVEGAISGAAQRLRETTLTWELRPQEHLTLKLETRYDRSTADVFGDENGQTDRQFLALAGAVVTF